MTRVQSYERPFEPSAAAPELSSASVIAVRVIGALSLAAFFLVPLSLALDPRWRWVALGLFAPLLLTPVLMGGIVLGGIGASLQGLRDLVRDRRTRVIHGLEHATAQLLQHQGYRVLSGQTELGYFNLRLKDDLRRSRRKKRPPRKGGPRAIRQAFQKAERLIRHGHPNLALHWRCGTSWIVVAALGSILALLAGGVGMTARLNPTAILFTVGGIVFLLMIGAWPLGLLVQYALTVATDFQRARVTRIVRRIEPRGSVCYELHLEVTLRGASGGRKEPA